MTYREIGSEFWLKSIPKRDAVNRDGIFVLSGRTALDIIIKDIQRWKNVKNVYIPAYCCESMIVPFQRNNIKVELYDMELIEEGFHYQLRNNIFTDILYVTNYFGYETTLPIQAIEHFKNRGAVILYDRTHSMLMDDSIYQQLADYTFCSIRKWMGIVTGAYVTKKSGDFYCNLSECNYWQEKFEAMFAKAKYVEGDDSIDKQSFLDAFVKFGDRLTEDYVDYQMDDLSFSIWKSTDMKLIHDTRRQNAKLLHDTIDRVQFIGSLTDLSCPLFVPIFFKTSVQRNIVRKKLISNKIYCPIHWPKNSLVTNEMKVNELFEKELSLVCDQRYGAQEMKKISDVINKSMN